MIADEEKKTAPMQALVWRDRAWSTRPAKANFDPWEKVYEHYSPYERVNGADTEGRIDSYYRNSADPELPLFLVDLNLGSHCELIEVDRTQDFIDLLVYLAPFVTQTLLGNLLGGEGADLFRAALGDQTSKDIVARKKEERLQFDRDLKKRLDATRAARNTAG